jgi:hypothetical protein
MVEQSESKDSNVKATIDAVAGLAKAIPIYPDAIQPAAKQVGQSLETVAKAVNIALAPIKGLVWGYEKIETFITTRVTEKLKNVPEEKITTPPPEVAGPAIEALRFAGHDQNLRELYANLLATSMDKDTVHLAHPGYVDILKNITSDEALLLQAFIEQGSYPVINIIGLHGGEDTDEYSVLQANYSHLSEIVDLQRPDLVPAYLDNLCRLGILQIPSGVSIPTPNTYEPLETDKNIKTLKKVVKLIGQTIDFQRRLVKRTTFGSQFIKNVVIGK